MLSNFLAELWGISLVLISLSLIIKDKYIKRIFSAIEDDEMFCWGIASMVMGVAMVLSHNIWVKNWTVVITIFGWASLAKGLAMIFLPDLVKKWTKKIESSTAVLSLALLAALFVGLVLTYLGFTA